jgi:gas vesicle protein
LFAPEKGSETRDKLNESLKSLGDSIKDRAADEISNLTHLKDKVTESIKTKLKGAEDEFEAAKESVSKVADKTERTISQVKP